MSRLIDADGIVVNAIKERKFVIREFDPLHDHDIVIRTGYADLADFIAAQPTVDAVLTSDLNVVLTIAKAGIAELFAEHLKESAVGVINLGERYFCIKESDIDKFIGDLRGASNNA